jgi:GNAT superfamily N-acetyltransferase
MGRTVTTYYLEMLDRSQHTPKVIDDPKFEVVKVNIPSPHFNQYLYEQVGADWEWIDRRSWSDRQWHEYAHSENLHTFVAYYDGAPAGYYELDVQPDGNVEIAYFGLLPQFIGKGLGGVLLSSAISDAWALGARRVWVHTCTLDHPRALGNYQRRGFTLYKQETKAVGV